MIFCCILDTDDAIMHNHPLPTNKALLDWIKPRVFMPLDNTHSANVELTTYINTYVYASNRWSVTDDCCIDVTLGQPTKATSHL